MRTIFITTTFLFLILIPSPVNAAREIHSMSFPAISADGKTIYFTAWGDIWRAPRDGSYPAIKLTDNVAYEGRPTPSPDGKQLAFLSDRWGNYDIFVMSSDGGAATRLTWDSKTDYPYDWNSDGTKILAYTQRQDLWETAVYEIPIDGGPAKRITGPDHDDHVFCSYLQNDNHVVYTRGPADWARKGHKGQNTYDLWTYDITSEKHTQVTDKIGNDMWPQPSPDGKKIYYVSSRDGSHNIWVLDLKSKKSKQLTHFKGDGTLWPRISSDGDEIVCEVFGDIYVVSTKDGKIEKVPIRFTDDPKHEMVLETDFVNRISEYSLSPNGNYYAVIVMGDIYILKNPDKYKPDEKPDQDLNRTFKIVSSPGREMHLDWHPKSTKLAYVSDRDDQFDIYTFDLVTLEETRITDTPNDEWYPDFAPHGEKFGYYSGNRKLMMYDLEKKEHVLLREGQIRNGPFCLGYEWSPDGKWIAFTEAIVDYLTDIFIVNTEDKSVVDVSLSPDYDSGATWSHDGKYLAYSTGFEEGTNVMLVELDPEEEKYDTSILFPEDIPKKEEEVKEDKEEKKEEEIKEEEPKEEVAEETEKKEGKPEEKKEDAEEKKKDEKKEEVKPVTIDFDMIHLRAKPIVKMAGDSYEPRFAPTNDYLIFRHDREDGSAWWSYTIEKEEFQNLTDATGKDYPMWSPDGKRLHFLSNESVVYLDMNGPKSAGQGSLRMTSNVYYDQYQIWEQMLFEGWRHIRDTFYDKKLHGTDWNDVLKRYKPRVRDCGTIEEYSTLYRLMLGEMNASHLSFYPKDNDREAPPDNTAELGVIYDEKFDGPGWMIKRVVKDSPADKSGSKLYEGDVILKINDHEIIQNDDRSKLLRNLADKPLKLVVRNDERVVNAKTDEKIDLLGEPQLKERDVVIKPINYGSLRPLLYEQWVRDNRKIVDDKTNGRIGYLHIESMNDRNLKKFRQELFGEYMEKEALIIDVRFNSGGYIAVDIVDLLDRRPAYIHQHRDSKVSYRPQLTWKGPIVVLIDAHSFSNAEILSHIMRDLGMATIIGETTGGGVISTYTFRLMDGSSFRMPAWMNARLDGTNMELNGVVPDIFVHIDPHQLKEGKDNQLNTAIDYLLKKL